MVDYLLIPAARLDEAAVSRFLNEFGEVAEFLPRTEGDPSTPLWVMRGKPSAFWMSLRAYGETSFLGPEAVMRFLGIDFEPVVLVGSKNNDDIPAFYSLMVAAQRHFGGILDYGGRVVSRIDAGDFSDPEEVLNACGAAGGSGTATPGV